MRLATTLFPTTYAIRLFFTFYSNLSLALTFSIYHGLYHHPCDDNGSKIKLVLYTHAFMEPPEIQPVDMSRFSFLFASRYKLVGAI